MLIQRNRFFAVAMLLFQTDSGQNTMAAFDSIAERAQGAFSMIRPFIELIPNGENAFCTAAQLEYLIEYFVISASGP